LHQNSTSDEPKRFSPVIHSNYLVRLTEQDSYRAKQLKDFSGQSRERNWIAVGINLKASATNCEPSNGSADHGHRDGKKDNR
jgi:hypothetical protein